MKIKRTDLIIVNGVGSELLDIAEIGRASCRERV
jgi:hypothetical protein